MAAELLKRIGVGIAIASVLAAVALGLLTSLPIMFSFAIGVVGIMTGVNIARIPYLPKTWFQQTLSTGRNNPAPNSRFRGRVPDVEEPKTDAAELKAELEELRRRHEHMRET